MSRHVFFSVVFLSASLFISTGLHAAPASLERPVAGKASIYPESEVKPGQKATVWTVFSGSEPEAVPIEIIGVWKNAWGPKQDIILGKMGGKAERTGVAAGMSGSPVYIDGRLVGALSLSIGAFTKDAICGITPIEYMLEINDFDPTRPADAKTPGEPTARAAAEVPSELLTKAVAAGVSLANVPKSQFIQPIETPLTFSGFTDNTLREFGPMFQQMGVTAVQAAQPAM